MYNLGEVKGHVVVSLDKALYDKLSLLGGFEQAANSNGKRLNVNRKNWKMVNS